MENKTLKQIFLKIFPIILISFGVPLCIGADTYLTRIDSGDSFSEALKAASIVFAVWFVLPNLFAFYVWALMEAEMNKN